MVTRLLTSDVEELVAFGLIYIMCLIIRDINFPLIFVEKYKMFLQHLFYLRSPQIISPTISLYYNLQFNNREVQLEFEK